MDERCEMLHNTLVSAIKNALDSAAKPITSPYSERIDPDSWLSNNLVVIGIAVGNMAGMDPGSPLIRTAARTLRAYPDLLQLLRHIALVPSERMFLEMAEADVPEKLKKIMNAIEPDNQP